MKTLTLGMLTLALFAFTGSASQAALGHAPSGVSAHYTRSNSSVHKRRYYAARPYYGARPNYGYRNYTYRPYYRNYYRPAVRSGFYYSGPGYYFGTGAYRYYPQPYPYYYSY